MRAACARSVVVIVASLVFAARVLAADLPATFDAARDAARDVEHAVELAKAQGKRVIVDVGGEWCTWCHIMDRFIAENADVRAMIDAHFVLVKVNYSRQNTNEALLSRWPKVAGYPHLFVLDATGALVHSQDTGALEGGRSYDKAKFLAFLDRASTMPARSADRLRRADAGSRRWRLPDRVLGMVGLPGALL
jgi:thiol:disulfide interchange protein